MSTLFIGIDLGTSGCRAYAIDEDENIVETSDTPLPKSTLKNGHVIQQPADWWHACQTVLFDLLNKIDRHQVSAIAVDGTSGTVLLCELNGTPVTAGYMYNDNANLKQAARIKKNAPNESGAHGVSSGLAKCLFLLEENAQQGLTCLNQADWVAGMLLNRFDSSDENNALKLGYDPVTRAWPTWLHKLNCLHALPKKIYQPGTLYGEISKEVAVKLNLPATTKIVAGTTDSIAAFIATGCNKIGEAVTSLGSTLAIKLISDKPIFAPEYGIYSHRLGNQWLIGGASNTGGAVLKSFFSRENLVELSKEIDPTISSNLNYYPLTRVGERFPISDPLKQPLLIPRPKDDVLFLHGLLESIANIEKMAFDKLKNLGAPYPTKIITMGGGSQNENWRMIRERICAVKIEKANTAEAAFGVALLAKNSIK